MVHQLRHGLSGKNRNHIGIKTMNSKLKKKKQEAFSKIYEALIDLNNVNAMENFPVTEVLRKISKEILDLEEVWK